MDNTLMGIYDEYANGGTSRREFFDRLAKVAGGTAAALGLLPMLGYDYAYAQTIAETDPRLTTSKVEYDAAGGKMAAYLAQPKDGKKHAAVIVIHENRGLNPHIQDVARRLAAEGFLALAPDALSPVGGTPAEETKAIELIGKLDAAETVARLTAAIPFLAKHAGSTGKVGVVGFCWGGGMVNRMAAAAGASLNAGVSYYGPQIPAADVPKIQAPLLLHYGGTDQRINAGIEAYETALKANNKTYEKFIYDGAGHAFNNDTRDTVYNKDAATLAWTRTIAFFKKNLA
ncbi:MAG: dienelactone hydrolase family protein [Acidobacteriota bacterium]